MIRDDEQPQENKNTNPPPPQNLQSQSFSSLPYEIAENIIARVSKCKYPTLSLVSKSFHSLLSSPELYKTRSHIGTTEPCLYLCLKPSGYQHPKIFTLWMKPVDETLTDHDDGLLPHDEDNHRLPHDDYSLFPVPSCSNHNRELYHPNHILQPYYSTVVVGSELYVIGGSYKAPSSAVRILDCRTHTWRDGPSMLVARWYTNAFLLDDKIYVVERSRSNEALAWIEVLDIKTQTWRHVRSHYSDEIGHCWDSGWFVVNVFKGKIYAIADKKSIAYDPQESTWEVVGTHMAFKFIKAWCVVEDVMYCFTNSGYCMWYDSKAGDWMYVMGSDLQALCMHKTSSLRRSWGLEVSNLGGKLLVMWIPEYGRYKREPERRIWCAKIALEKRGSEVWGKIEWANSVYESYWFSSCVVWI